MSILQFQTKRESSIHRISSKLSLVHLVSDSVYLLNSNSESLETQKSQLRKTLAKYIEDMHFRFVYVIQKLMPNAKIILLIQHMPFYLIQSEFILISQTAQKSLNITQPQEVFRPTLFLKLLKPKPSLYSLEISHL